MTRSELEKIKATYPLSKAVERLSTDLSPDIEQQQSIDVNRKLEIRPTTDEAKLNKLEIQYLNFLKNQQPHWIGVQSVTLKIGHDCRYTADFFALDDTGLRAIDVKGGHTWEDSLIKLRCAARLFPFIHFVIAKKINGVWQHTPIKP